MNSAVSNWRVGLPFALAASVTWALIPILIKGLLSRLDPMTVTWFRHIGCAVPMAAWFLWRRPDWRGLRRADTRRLVTICVVGLSGNALLFNLGLQYASPGAAHVIGQLGTVITLVGGVFIFRESFTRQQWLCACGILLGLALFFHNRFADVIALTSTGVGLILLALAPLLWAAYALAQKGIGGHLGSQQVLTLTYLFGTLVFLPIATPSDLLDVDGTGWFLLVAMTVLYMGSYMALGRAMISWESSRVSAILTVTPLLTLTFSHLVLVLVPDYMAHETTDPLSLLGALLVVGSSLRIALPRRRYS
jgi:drug/metabolite transporter (DMT)-like permease